MQNLQNIMNGERSEDDHIHHPLENSLRPQNFEEFPGQDKVVKKLKVFVEAALKRDEPLDHCLLCGPPGLGKTTLAHILAQSMRVPFQAISGPALHKKGDLAAILTNLEPRSVFFIDEIHRLNKDVEEYLYSAMEDYYLDMITGEGLGARSVRFQIAPFTLVGATTRTGLLKAPFRDRFGIVERLTFYNKDSLKLILMRAAVLMEMELTEEGAFEIARRSRGTPRVAHRLLRRVRDYAQVDNKSVINQDMARYALNELEVDELGLAPMDRHFLSLIQDKFNGGPVGIDTLSAALSEEVGTIEEVVEPFLIQEGLLQKTPRGRQLTEIAKTHLATL